MRYVPLSPRGILGQVAGAVPRECHKNIIIVGSLAAGYHFFQKDTGSQVRTKDVDCLLSPRIEAVKAGQALAQQLIKSGWKPREDATHGKPGTARTREQDLPAVRLFPPGSSEWFIELLTVPESEDDEGKRWIRMRTSLGDFGLPSFRFLSLAAFEPIGTEFGISYARPEMMVLASLLEHPRIRTDLMSGLIEGRKIKRSNKDLGRALAISWLSPEGASEDWPDLWVTSLRSRFPSKWIEVSGMLGAGLRGLLASDEDLEEAFHTCENGLLSSKSVTAENLRIAGLRLIQDAVLPFENLLIHSRLL